MRHGSLVSLHRLGPGCDNAPARRDQESKPGQEEQADGKVRPAKIVQGCKHRMLRCRRRRIAPLRCPAQIPPCHSRKEQTERPVRVTSSTRTNRRKSSVRAKVEHPFLTLKRIWGFVKVRYRGLEKNANRAFAMLAIIIENYITV